MPSSLTAQYGHKIKTVEALRAAIGSRPRRKTVIMCHGVFDVVHPGHVRHMLYAKSKADVLVASLTADRHIAKGLHRPHVPQDLRALNLAAFEMVDYVIVDPNERPIENIQALQPDFFAKGYEYGGSGSSEKTEEEISALAAYGGEMIFTPGDVVYSSSRLIDLVPPEIGDEKLVTAMERHGVTFDGLRRTLAEMKERRVHVVGDTIVDSLTSCAMIGGQTKTPTLSVLYEGRQDFVGGAGIVAKHLRAAGADVVFSTVLGEDHLGAFARDDLRAAGVTLRALADSTRPTTHKNAFVVGGYRLLKVDTLDNRPIGDGLRRAMAATITDTPADAVVFSDFRHGVFNRHTLPTLTHAIPDGVFRVADSQVASRWGNITEFKGFDLITPNEREARFALGDQDSSLRPLASRLYDVARCGTLILKVGDRGALTCTGDDHERPESFLTIDSFADHVVDPVGAGDALLAYATLSMLVTRSPAVATILGSMAAACVCARDGNTPVTPDAVTEKIDAVERRVNFG